MFRTDEQKVEIMAWITYSHATDKTRPSREELVKFIARAERAIEASLTDVEKEYVINCVNGYGLWT